MSIKSLSRIFGSQTKAQEILLLLHDAKEVVRQGFYEEEWAKVEQFCREQALFLAKSKFKVLLADDEFYSNKGVRIPERDKRKGMYFAYVSKDEEKALLASYYELMNNYQDLGRVLGYPECCVNFFLNHFNRTGTDLQLPPTNPYTNLSRRADDAVLLSHFPCRSDCVESIALAKRYLEVISRVDRGRAIELMEKLKVSHQNAKHD